ncbi:hypothetical protein F5887DRAFT_1078089 [Amanita rubescens]|nr:hypothetical protein F5887DRAFT_1078089 [Amanita rubescens]
MPPKRSTSQMATLAKARMASCGPKQDVSEPCTPESPEELLEKCRKELSAAQIELAQLNGTLQSKVASRLSTWLRKEKESNRELSKELAVALQKLYVLQKQLHVEKQGRKCASMQKSQLVELNNSLKAHGQSLTVNMSNMVKEIEHTKLQLESEKNLSFYQSELRVARKKFDAIQGELRNEKRI